MVAIEIISVTVILSTMWASNWHEKTLLILPTFSHKSARYVAVIFMTTWDVLVTSVFASRHNSKSVLSFDHSSTALCLVLHKDQCLVRVVLTKLFSIIDLCTLIGHSCADT